MNFETIAQLPDIATKRSAALKEISAQYTRTAKRLAGDVDAFLATEYERAFKEAELYTADPAAQSIWPNLQADVDAGTMSTLTSTPVTTLAAAAAHVIAVGGGYYAALETMRATRKQAQAAIAAATDDAGLIAALTPTWPA